jgi:hypothetical protein
MRLCVVAAVIAASTSVASAGTYLGAGIGTSASLGGDHGRYAPDGRSGRLIVGFGFGRIGVEANATRYGLENAGVSWDATTVAAALRVAFPIGYNFELFGRGGVERTWLTTGGNAPEPSGNGWLLGAGVDYKVNLGITGGAIFIDYTHNDTGFSFTDAHAQRATFDQTAGMWTLGLTLSI